MLVKKYYSEQSAKEWRRVVRDAYHRLEFDTTVYFMRKYLPKEGIVLDAGCGPGRYAIEFGKMGYDVVLFDLSQEMLEIAKKQVKRSGVQKANKILQGSIDDLSMFGDETFDAAACLGGSLSHLLDEAKRGKAVDELIRVTKKGSPIFVSVIGRTAVLVSELIRSPQEIELEFFKAIRDTGDYSGGYGFAPCHFYLPEELRFFLGNHGLEVLEMVGLEGLASGHLRETNRLAKKYPVAWKTWWETHLKTCFLPTAIGISEHFLAICRKP